MASTLRRQVSTNLEAAIWCLAASPTNGRDSRSDTSANTTLTTAPASATEPKKGCTIKIIAIKNGAQGRSKSAVNEWPDTRPRTISRSRTGWADRPSPRVTDSRNRPVNTASLTRASMAKPMPTNACERITSSAPKPTSRKSAMADMPYKVSSLRLVSTRSYICSM